MKERMMDFLNRRAKELPKPTEYIEPPEPPRKEPEVYYSVGRTSVNTLMTLKMGYTTLTMTKYICKDLIAQLELVSNQLEDVE